MDTPITLYSTIHPTIGDETVWVASPTTKAEMGNFAWDIDGIFRPVAWANIHDFGDEAVRASERWQNSLPNKCEIVRFQVGVAYPEKPLFNNASDAVKYVKSIQYYPHVSAKLLNPTTIITYFDADETQAEIDRYIINERPIWREGK